MNVQIGNMDTRSNGAGCEVALEGRDDVGARPDNSCGSTPTLEACTGLGPVAGILSQSRDTVTDDESSSIS